MKQLVAFGCNMFYKYVILHSFIMLSTFLDNRDISMMRDVSLFSGGGGGGRATNFLSKAPKKFCTPNVKQVTIASLLKLFFLFFIQAKDGYGCQQ